VQPELDAELRARLAEWPNASMRLDEVGGAHRRGPPPHSALANGEVLRARYVLACDGGGSTLRRLAGATVEDMAFDEPWIVVDTLLQREVPLPPTNVQSATRRAPAPSSTAPASCGAGTGAGEDAQEMAREENIWRLLARWISPATDAVADRAYRFHAVVVHRMAARPRAGRRRGAPRRRLRRRPRPGPA
jgi:3-(3-hydroxy-phenyl)propionate hydroxylase